MGQTYLCKFDSTGRRTESLISCEFTEEEKQQKIAEGYIEISEEDWNYYVGNKGTGANGTGYIRGADGKPISAPPHVPTKEEKLAQLEAEYKTEKAKLEGYFNTALLMDDTETQEELKAEMADLADWYEEEKKSILD